IQGEVNVDCDRCAQVYKQELLDEFRVYVKFDDRNLDVESDDEDVILISRGDSHLDIANQIYDFVNLSVPLQKICAEKRNTDESCNETLNRYLAPEKKQEEIDQRWSALEKFKKQ